MTIKGYYEQKRVTLFMAFWIECIKFKVFLALAIWIHNLKIKITSRYLPPRSRNVYIDLKDNNFTNEYEQKKENYFRWVFVLYFISGSRYKLNTVQFSLSDFLDSYSLMIYLSQTLKYLKEIFNISLEIH